MTEHRELAAAVLTQLLSGAYSQVVAFSRQTAPEVKRESLAGYTAIVAPSARKRTAVDRGRIVGEYSIDVALFHPIDPAETRLTEEDAAMDVLDELDRRLAGQALAAMSSARWLSVETVSAAEAGFSPDTLRQQNLFLGVLRHTYRVG